MGIGVTCEVRDCKGQPLKFCKACVRFYCPTHYDEHKEWLPGTTEPV
jgi:hypothetical protein